jgi:hypothetical protein
VGEARWINQGSPNNSEVGLVAKVGYYLTPNLRLGTGYAFGQANDRDFNGTRTVNGPFTEMTRLLIRRKYTFFFPPGITPGTFLRIISVL